ncbi:neural precursor cell expressed, developmentally down-regulated 1 [Ictidomys tridecemlineatus]|nr:neural precursor cell expressed, developmentally down-regulated 1 [Ictidomys tridecemlineatus]
MTLQKFPCCVGVFLITLSLVCIVANALLLVPDGKTWSTDQLSLQVLLMPGFIGGGLMLRRGEVPEVRESAGSRIKWVTSDSFPIAQPLFNHFRVGAPGTPGFRPLRRALRSRRLPGRGAAGGEVARDSRVGVLHLRPRLLRLVRRKEENENHDLIAESKKAFLGKQDPKDSFKQFAKLISSGTETGNLNSSPSSNQTRNLEKFEKPEKEFEAQFIYEPPVNGSSTPNPKIASSVTADVASSLSEKIVDTIGNYRPNAPLTSVQIRFIRNMIQETLDDFREACHRDIVNLQVEMIKQFHMQLNEMHSLLERYSVNEGLVAEIERL